jgi:hypothetical protein
LTLQPVVFDRCILAFDDAGLVEAFAKRNDITHCDIATTATDKSDDRRRVLRMRPERPRHRRAAKQADERPSSHIGHGDSSPPAASLPRPDVRFPWGRPESF